MARRRRGGWRGPDFPGEFPSLGYQVADWIQAHCAIPDGDHVGEPYELTDEMLRFLVWFYRVDPAKERFFFNRGGQLVRPQKWGKGPFSAAIICAEAAPDGPVRFNGWDAAGEPVGRPWATPWIQVTAVSEDQTDNVWTALQPMIELGALAADIPDTGLTRINLPDGGKIEPVTSSARSRLGQRITFTVQDEPHSYTAQNGGRKLADTQRRNLAGMGGRWLETTNAWDPQENSVAQQTAEAREPGVFFDDVEPGKGSIRNKVERRRMLKKVYGDSWWVDLDRIDDEIVVLLARDPAQAERFYLNRKQASEDAAFAGKEWDKLAKPRGKVDPGSIIAIGVDGARFHDALGIRATDVRTGRQWTLGVWERPARTAPDYEHPFDEVDGVMIDAFEHFDPWRVYVDPQHIEHLLQTWQGRWGDNRVIAWWTNRPRPIAWAVRNFTDAIGAQDLTHDGCPDTARHIRNAKKKKLRVYDDDREQMHTLAKEFPQSPHKIDLAMASVLSWECRGDAIAAGVLEQKKASRVGAFL